MPCFKMERRPSESEDRLALGEICLLIDAAEGIMRRGDVLMWKTKKKGRQRKKEAESGECSGNESDGAVRYSLGTG